MKHLTLATCALTGLLTACGGGGAGGGASTPAGPSGLTYGQPDATYLVQVEAQENVPTFQGQVSSWSIAPALPAGLALDSATGVIGGTPLAASVRATHVVTAKGPYGQTQTGLQVEVVLPARFAYTPGADDTIGIYTVDAYSGALRFHGLHHHEAPDAGAEQVAVHPSGRFVYVPNLGDSQQSSTITAYSVDAADGALELVGHTPVGEGPHRITFHPDGTHAYAISFFDHMVHVYSIDAITGALTHVQDIQTNTGPERLAVDPLGRFLYVAHRPSADIRIFTVQPDGTLTGDVGGFNYWSFIPTDVVVDRDGAFAYFVFELTNNLVSYRIDQQQGSLHDLLEAPTSGAPRAVVLHPAGGFAYVASTDSDTVDLFVLDPVTGGPTLQATYQAGTTPIALEFDASGRQLYALGADSNDVTTFAVDPKTGVLTPRSTVRTRAAATHLAVLRGETPARPREEFLYVANSESDDVAGFTIDVETGSLASTGSNIMTGESPGAVAVDPGGRYIWVANRVARSISIFTITPTTGALSENAAPLALGGTPGGLAVDPAGDHLFVSLEESDEVIGFSIGVTGELTEVDRAATGSSPASVSVDPTGQFVYVSNVGGNAHEIASYAVLAGTFLSGPVFEPAPGHPGLLRFAPDGAFAYAALETSELVVPYAIDSQTGALTVQAAGSKPTSTTPATVSLTPDGRFAYASVPGEANEDGFVARFAVNATSGALTPMGETHEGLSPSDLIVGPTGRFLYVANAAGDDLTVFEIDETSGDLTLVGHTAAGLSPEALILATRVD